MNLHVAARQRRDAADLDQQSRGALVGPLRPPATHTLQLPFTVELALEIVVDPPMPAQQE
ncbi:hypothetical protein [Rhodococcus sp. EPR-157]|uniref:hypothetical protein n=1 Tax=Rhodococcus sp. EPR-157 TaxID=1813677 RepID=UPI000A9854FA|nr:hypothetical protein [Rhodococcus sp. EPR-157]